MSSVKVTLEEKVIYARYVGTMTKELVQESQGRIEALLAENPDCRILYDCMAMTPPPMKLALQMKAFDSRIASRVVRSATVVKDSMSAFMSKVAFAMSRNHRVFYDDIPNALAWLKTASTVSASR